MEAEMEVTRLDGEKVFCMITHFPVLDSAGHAIGIGGIHVNISEIKDKERQLRIARDEAERANHAKSAFLANMSHARKSVVEGKSVSVRVDLGGRRIIKK